MCFIDYGGGGELTSVVADFVFADFFLADVGFADVVAFVDAVFEPYMMGME